jgi:hypothetical protein
MKRTMSPKTKALKLSKNEERKRGKQLKLVEIPEHGIVCSCVLIQLLKTLLGNMVLVRVSLWTEKLMILLYVLLWEKLK